MIRFRFNGVPATLNNGVVDFTGTEYEGVEEEFNAEVRFTADNTPGYFPDLNEVALLLLRETGEVEIIEETPPTFDPNVTY